MRRIPTFALMVALVSSLGFAGDVDVGPLIQKIRAVGPRGEGHREATTAWKSLSQADSSQLVEILAGMKGADLLALNWLRSAAESIADRDVKSGRKLPVQSLEAFLSDTKQAPRARRLAYELIATVDKNAEQRLIPRLADDPSVELRRDAVALLLKDANSIDAEKGKDRAIAAYRRAFASARDLDQIKDASEKLKKLGATPNLREHFGFILSWKLIGPFDNTNKKGFDVAYPPESAIDLNASYDGKQGKVSWISHTTQDENGLVDLNKAISKHMGAVAYAYAEFNSDQQRDVELRLGCINGNKIWLNGELLTANHVYHTGMQIDQYVAQGTLKKGTNKILIKVAQNEQTDTWAQNWQFQFRICDSVGTPIAQVK
jgi:hypothetical protein